MTGPTLIVLMKKLTVIWAVITASLFAQEILRPTTVAGPVLDPVIITLIGGMIVTVISAIVTGIVTVITALRQGESNKKLENVSARQMENNASLVTMAKDTEAIKGHVNSEKTASLGREAMLLRENQFLNEALSKSEQRASLLAQAAAVRIREAPATSVVPPSVAVTESLVNIDTNTAAIKKNTARTEADVKDLKAKS